ncbi:MAG: undecaprenyl-diphosphate phosphatase [Clostridiales bacterium]|nr:undecaprenyl-diphosphate phosphatase [Clostridiales bacterium]
MIEIFKTILIGIVQGITEWLPISSTGHMILLDQLISLDVSDDFRKMFFVVIQLGSILAVVVLYFKKLNPFSTPPQEKKRVLSLWGKIIIGVIPAGVVGILLDDWLDEHFYNYITVAVTLVLYGILFIIIERRRKGKRPSFQTVYDIDYKTAVAIGCFQVLSLVPGTSRSGSTILGGMLMGSSRTAASEFSFFLAVPVMLGASLIKVLKFGFAFSSSQLLILLVGCTVAFLVSMAAIRFLISFVRKNSFELFGWYRIALGCIVLGYYLFIVR